MKIAYTHRQDAFRVGEQQTSMDQNQGQTQEQAHVQAMDTLIDKLAAQGMGELVVTPREVDELVGRVGRIIADGLNLAFQPRLTEEEIQLLSHDGP